MSYSDITYETSSFNPANVSEETKAVTKYLLSQASSGSSPKFWDLGVPEYRKLQDEGKTSWPAPTFRLKHATYINVPSREPGRQIKCRLVPPQNGKPSGVFLFSHGGGHVLGHCDWYDVLLDKISKSGNLVVVSPEYRLAPEHPFPSGNEDVFDVAEYVVDHFPTIYGCPLLFLGGESAGATLSMHTFLHLHDTRPDFNLAGLALIYGLYDWSLLPAARNFTTPLIMTSTHIQHYGDLYLGNITTEEKRAPEISPIYHSLFRYPGSSIAEEEKKEAKLPPTLFLCGTRDAVVDDNILMSFRYQIAGGEATVRFVEGAPHAFLLFPEQLGMVVKGQNILTDFLREKVNGLGAEERK